MGVAASPKSHLSTTSTLLAAPINTHGVKNPLICHHITLCYHASLRQPHQNLLTAQSFSPSAPALLRCEYFRKESSVATVTISGLTKLSVWRARKNQSPWVHSFKTKSEEEPPFRNTNYASLCVRAVWHNYASPSLDVSLELTHN